MKKIIFIAVATLLVAAPQEAIAQAFLKKLKDKAVEKVKEKIENKVEKTVDKTVDGVLDGKKITGNSTSSAEKAEVKTVKENGGERYTPTEEYAKSLLKPTEKIHKLTEIRGINDEESADYKKAKQMSFSQLLNARSAYLNAADMFTKEGNAKIEAAKKQAEINATGYFVYIGKLTEEHMKLKMQDPTAGLPRATHANDKRIAFGKELMAYLQSKGINPEKSSEAEMQKYTLEFVGQKIGVSGAELQKMAQMGQPAGDKYMKEHYPEAWKKAQALGISGEEKSAVTTNPYQNLIDELQAIDNSLYGTMEQRMDKLGKEAEAMSKIAANDISQYLQKTAEKEQDEIHKTMSALAGEISASWPNSDACKKVNEMEKALDERLHQWMTANNKNYNNAFPTWWKESRVEQNKVINAWNAAQAEKWNAKLKEVDKKLKVTLEKIAAVEGKLNQQSGGKKDIYYLIVNDMIQKYYSELIEYFSVPFYLLDCPQASNVSEVEDPV